MLTGVGLLLLGVTLAADLDWRALPCLAGALIAQRELEGKSW